MKKILHIRWFVPLFILIYALGCKEVYDPTIDQQQRIISVEGMITNRSEPYFIKLNTTGVYGSENRGAPLQNARVTITDDAGDTYEFTEVDAGIYQSPIDMLGVVGNTYELEIVTEDNITYKSYPQTMMPTINIGSLDGEKTIRKTYLETQSGELIEREVEGIEITLATLFPDENIRKIRFQTDLLVLYTTYMPSENPMLPPDLYYCWKVKKKVEGINNINLPTATSEAGSVENNVIAFIPDGREYFGFSDLEFVHNIAIFATLYHMNDDAYQFYRDVNKQLTSDGSLFAPIASQIFSNIFCVTDPSLRAVGLFEASAVERKDFILRKPPAVDEIYLEHSDAFWVIDRPNCLLDVKPFFWIENEVAR